MTLTNVEKELIATQINKLEESFEKVMEHPEVWCIRHDTPSGITEPIGEVREIINDLKRYWIERQQ
jgi:aspartate aminotransferase-like enzyme